MGINGIDRAIGSPDPVGASEPPEALSAEDIAAQEPAAPTLPAGSPELAQLKAGEISADVYLEAQLEEATRHLEGVLSPEEQQQLREHLAAELQSDPALAELVARVIGRSGGT